MEMLQTPLGRADLAVTISQYEGRGEVQTGEETISIRDLSERFDRYYEAL
jgi:hypothetical protein